MTDTTTEFARQWNEATASVALDGETQSAPPEPAPPEPEQPRRTPQQIIDLIGQPVLVRDGRYLCPVCSMSYEHAQALGPHFRVHWQEAGVKLEDIPSVTDGRAKCPECSVILIRHSLSGHLKIRHDYDNARANGVARIYGFNLDAYLNPPPPPAPPETINYEGRQQQLVDCPYKRCGATHKRKYMRRHLEAVHNIDSGAAIRQTRALEPSRRTESVPSKLPGARGGKPKPTESESAVVAVVEQATEPTVAAPPESTHRDEGGAAFDFTDISASDIAIGVIQSQVNGSIPTAMLPDILQWTDHTREFVTKLREAGS